MEIRVQKKGRKSEIILNTNPVIQQCSTKLFKYPIQFSCNIVATDARKPSKSMPTSNLVSGNKYTFLGNLQANSSKTIKKCTFYFLQTLKSLKTIIYLIICIQIWVMANLEYRYEFGHYGIWLVLSSSDFAVQTLKLQVRVWTKSADLFPVWNKHL